LPGRQDFSDLARRGNDAPGAWFLAGGSRIARAAEEFPDLNSDQPGFELLASGIGHGKQCLINLVQVVGSATIFAEQ
jgi:hypothetical protein